MNKPISANSFFLAAMLSLFALTSLLSAQSPFTARNQKDRLNDPFGRFNIGGPADDEEKVTLRAEFKVEPETRNGKIYVTAKIIPGWHVYSLHNPGNSMSTTLKLADNPALETVGSFRPATRPQVHLIEIEGNTPTYDEYHEGEVVWVAPIRFKKDADPKTVELEVEADGQVCQTACALFTVNAKATYAGELEAGGLTMKPSVSLPAFGGAPTNSVEFKSELKLEKGKGEGWLIVDTEVVSGFHIYSQQNTSGSTPTKFELSEKKGFKAIGNFVPSIDPHVYFNPGFEEFEESFEGSLKWVARVRLADDTEPESLKLNLKIEGQVCDADGCLQVEETIPVTFAGYANPKDIELFGTPSHETSTAENGNGNPQDKKQLLNLDALDPVGVDTNKYSFGMILLFALMGGFILNFMPCVLPVIGLKVMSFVNQAGSNRMQALTLNLWYVGGMLAVFMVLATLAVVFNLGWGQQSQSVVFNIVMATVVFAMGLSFLGVWEIPIPGFVGTGKAAEVAQKEGPSAAFVKGIITTILAVPCSGPGLATALTYSAGKPPWIVYSIFLCLGLGMALPYIVIGLKPDLVKFLPKPGAWMDTFKQVMGFFLLGTVVFVMSYIPWEMRLATLAFLIGIWFCCWLIGRMPIAADPGVKLRTWVVAATFGVVFGFIAFTWIADMSEHRFQRDIDKEIALRMQQSANSEVDLLTQVKSNKIDSAELEWQPFTIETLSNETASQTTVLVDFTADW